MINVGEQLVSSYLRHILHCDFTQTSVYTIQSQGDIDVVGLNLTDQQAYICEVAIHLTGSGIQYTKNGKVNNVDKLTEKFCKDIEYADEYLSEYDKHFMLWSPIVKGARMPHIEKVKENIMNWCKIEIELVVNEKFQECLTKLRDYAKSQTRVLQCPLLRLMQIEEVLNKYVTTLIDKSRPQA